jgi:hypothetical protein
MEKNITVVVLLCCLLSYESKEVNLSALVPLLDTEEKQGSKEKVQKEKIKKMTKESQNNLN